MNEVPLDYDTTLSGWIYLQLESPKAGADRKEIFEEIMAGHFPNLMTNDEFIDSGSSINTHTRNRKKKTLSLIIIKMLKILYKNSTSRRNRKWNSLFFF